MVDYTIKRGSYFPTKEDYGDYDMLLVHFESNDYHSDKKPEIIAQFGESADKKSIARLVDKLNEKFSTPTSM